MNGVEIASRGFSWLSELPEGRFFENAGAFTVRISSAGCLSSALPCQNGHRSAGRVIFPELPSVGWEALRLDIRRRARALVGPFSVLG